MSRGASDTSTSDPDLYVLLSVPANATTAQIRAAYLEKILDVHPDRSHDRHEAEDLAARLNEAWAVLGDSERRTAYDRRRQRPRDAGTRPTATARSIDLSDLDHDDQVDAYIYVCRCGRSLTIREEALEAAVAQGQQEVLVECDGCSQRVRVLFALEEDAEDRPHAEEPPPR